MNGVPGHPNKYSLVNSPCRHAEEVVVVVGGGDRGGGAGLAAPAGAGVTSERPLLSIVTAQPQFIAR